MAGPSRLPPFVGFDMLWEDEMRVLNYWSKLPTSRTTDVFVRDGKSGRCSSFVRSGASNACGAKCRPTQSCRKKKKLERDVELQSGEKSAKNDCLKKPASVKAAANSQGCGRGCEWWENAPKGKDCNSTCADFGNWVQWDVTGSLRAATDKEKVVGFWFAACVCWVNDVV